MRNMLAKLTITLLIYCLSTHAFGMIEGEAEFADLSEFYDEPRVSIDLSANILAGLRKYSAKDKPELEEVLNKLYGVKVRIYHTGARSLLRGTEAIENSRVNLSKQGWKFEALYRNYQKIIYIASKREDDINHGLVIMTSIPDKKEIVFINIVGDVDRSDIKTVIRSLKHIGNNIIDEHEKREEKNK